MKNPILENLARIPWTVLADRISDAFFPNRCICCLRLHVDLTRDQVACNRCQPSLRPPAIRCLRCSASLPTVAGNQDDCLHCRTEKWHFKRAFCLTSYHGEIKDAVIASKKATNESVAFGFGKELGKWLNQLDLPDYDFCTPAPQYWTRRILRRTNSALTIAEAVSRTTGIPLRPWLVRRRRSTKKQGLLRTGERRKNVADAFSLKPNIDLSGQRVLIIDDVLTSGATASEIAATLKRGKAKQVDVAAISRGIGEGASRTEDRISA